ncbi:DUF1275 domain-containing protein [Microbacterium sp. LWS13-1.2]|uniref:DUF1275 domain-containing protein n=2 Tax=Microbacterium sp. LWS13-1.2 TaxID=3135264 RepID=A0AAU6S8M2_9MICO
MPGAELRTIPPLLERPQAAIALAASSGAMNAWTLANAGSFATVQSGNIVAVGFYGAQQDPARVIPVLLSVLAFGLGAFLCAIVVALVEGRGHKYSPWILAVEAIVVATSAALASAVPSMAIAITVSFIAGIQGNAFHRNSGVIYGNTAVTFVVQMTLSALGRATVSRIKADREPVLRIAGLYGSVVLAFAFGAAAGFLLDTVWRAASLVAVSVALAILAIVASGARGEVDPMY